MRVWVEDEDEVHIAGKIQLARAELAHRDHGETRAARRSAGVRQAQFPAVMRGAQQVGRGDAQRALGQVRQHARYLAQSPRAADIGHGGGQCDLPLCRAQQRAGFGPAQIGCHGHQAAERQVANRVRSLGEHRPQRVRLAAGQFGQIGAVATQAVEHAAERRVDRSGERLPQPGGGIRVGSGWKLHRAERRLPRPRRQDRPRR